MSHGGLSGLVPTLLCSRQSRPFSCWPPQQQQQEQQRPQQQQQLQQQQQQHPSRWSHRLPQLRRCHAGGSSGAAAALSAFVVGASASFVRRRRRRQLRRSAGDYRWEQGDVRDKEVRVFIAVPEDIKVKDVQFDLQPKKLRVSLQGNTQALIQGELWSEVDVDDTYFELERHDGVRYLVVYLAKCNVETWEQILRPCYAWEQTGKYNEEVRVYVPIEDGVSSADVEFRIGMGHIYLGISGSSTTTKTTITTTTTPFLDGELWGAVDIEDCSWMVDSHEGQRIILVSLAKLHVRENWDRFLKTEEGKKGQATFTPGSRKDVDLAVLDSLTYVHSLLNGKDLPYAREYLDHMLGPEEDGEGQARDEAQGEVEGEEEGEVQTDVEETSEPVQ